MDLGAASSPAVGAVEPPTAGPRWRMPVTAVVGYAAAGVAVAVLEGAGSLTNPSSDAVVAVAHLVLAGALGAALALSRFRPGSSLGTLAGVWVLSIVAGVDLTWDEIVLGVVAYSCARRGGAATVWASGLVLPSAYLLGGFYAVTPATQVAADIGAQHPAMGELASLTIRVAGSAALLAAPWLLGLTLRMRARAEESRRLRLRAELERENARRLQAKAETVARLQEQQTQLARDVHDVVGHSLAVILAQAESATYLGEPISEPVRTVLDTIASCARTSLTDVRNVLAAQPAAPDRTGDLDALIAQLPAQLGPIRDDVVGIARPLPPDVAVVAHRVLQEMLTNALRHGRPGAGIEVTRDWTDGLRLRVGNQVGNQVADRSRGAGLGLGSMRSRVEAAGGDLEVTDADGCFSVEARLPLRSPRDAERGA